MHIDEIKRRLRKLKRFEQQIRYGSGPATGGLVWNRFFGLSEGSACRARYSLQQLSLMDQQAYRRAVDEYMAFVYYELYQAQGLIFSGGHHDPESLAKLELPAFATEQDIKKRFRELARKYHPDAGGDAAMFIELMDHYKKLTGAN